MKLLFLLTQSLDYPSGLGRYWPLAKELARLGHQVRVAALHPALKSLPSREFRDAGVEVRYAGPMHVRQVGHERQYYGPLGLGWAVARGTWGLTWQALLADTDAIHLGKPHPQNGLAGLLGRLLRGRRLYLDCDDYEAESNRYGGDWQKRIVAFGEDKLPRFAQGITVNTRYTQQRLEALGYPPERIVYVPNGIDRERFAKVDPAQVEALRRRLGVEERPVVGYIGSLSLANHAIELLLKATIHLLESQPSAVLLLVGGGEDYHRLQQQAKTMGLERAVRFVGRIPPGDVPAYYALADVTVDPVHDDLAAQARCPLKIVESMAVDTPIVTGDVGDRRELLGDGQAGLLVAPGSAEALAEGLLTLLRNPNLGRSLGERGQRLAEQFYWDVQVHEFARVYEH